MVFYKPDKSTRLFVNTIWFTVLTFAFYFLLEFILLRLFCASQSIADLISYIPIIPLNAIFAYCCYRNYIMGETFGINDLRLNKIIPNRRYFILAFCFTNLWFIPLIIFTELGSFVDYVDVHLYDDDYLGQTLDQIIGYAICAFLIGAAIYIRLGIRIGALFPAAAVDQPLTRKQALELSKGRRGATFMQILLGPIITIALGIFVSDHFSPDDPYESYSGFGILASGFSPMQFLGGVVDTLFASLLTCQVVVILSDVFTGINFKDGTPQVPSRSAIDEQRHPR